MNILRPFSPPDAFYVRNEGCDAFLAKDQRVGRSNESIQSFQSPLSEGPDDGVVVEYGCSRKALRHKAGIQLHQTSRIAFQHLMKVREHVMKNIKVYSTLIETR